MGVNANNLSGLSQYVSEIPLFNDVCTNLPTQRGLLSVKVRGREEKVSMC